MTSEAARASDWRAPNNYDYMDFLSKRDWSWEGVRRNFHFSSDWQKAQYAFDRAESFGLVTIIRLHEPNTLLDRWGIVYSDEPSLDAGQARVLWRPDCYGGVLSIASTAASEDGNTPRFSLSAMQCPSLLILRPGDRQHVVFLGEGRGLQLVVHGESVLNPVRLMIDAAPGPRAARIQAELLKCFNDLSITGRMKPRYNLKKVSARRLKTVVRALDGAIAGASHKDIALAIYGAQRVQTDWDDPREHLKDHIRRTVRRGIRLMNGGYRSFLR